MTGPGDSRKRLSTRRGSSTEGALPRNAVIQEHRPHPQADRRDHPRPVAGGAGRPVNARGLSGESRQGVCDSSDWELRNLGQVAGCG